MRLKLLFVIAGLICAALLHGCTVADPLALTAREQIRSNAAVSIAEAEARAQIETARYAAEADITTTQTWAGMLPLAALIVVGGVLGGIVFYFQGKAYLVRVEYASGERFPPLPADHRRKLDAYARATDQRLELVDGQYYLVDKQDGRRVRALPKRSI